MAQRRHHYESAFEHYLRDRRIPYVAVDEAKKALLPGGQCGRALGCGAGCEELRALKSFDFVIYGDGTNLLVEVKGRRASCASARLENWVTIDDVRSLAQWENLFGSGFDAAFMFIYWYDSQPADALFEEVFTHGDRWYGLRSVGVREYAGSMRVRSPRWGTVDIPRRVFDRVSTSFSPRSLRAPPASFGTEPRLVPGALTCGDAAPLFASY